MKVFLSWSGKRSKEMAEVLKEWLKEVIQAVDPWISSDIEKGGRWSPEISAELENSRVGIICLTRENLNENWILFEAGALSKTKDTRVCTFLLDLKPTEIEQPLGQFQHTEFEKAEVRKLLDTLNEAVKKEKEHALDKKLLDKTFNRCWADLEEALGKIRNQGPRTEGPKRSQGEMLEEVLEVVRAMDRRQQLEKERETAISQAATASMFPTLGTFIPEEFPATGVMRNALRRYYRSMSGEQEKKRASATPKKKPKAE